MKRIYSIIGTIFTIIGINLFVRAKIEIATSSSWYTWSSPYSKYEMQVIGTKWLGIILIIIGIPCIVSAVLANRNESKFKNLITYKAKVCKKCGIQVSNETKICPKCSTKLEDN